MQENQEIKALVMQPGIQRDGTTLDTTSCVDGKWVRFYRGRPMKMGGYRQISKEFSGPSRWIAMYPRQDMNIVYSFWAGGVERLSVDLNGLSSSVSNSRTPTGFVVNQFNLWQTATIHDSSGGGNSVLVAHVAPNAQYIDSPTDGIVYHGVANATTPLVTTGQSVSGGCCVLHPYVFIYGNSGLIRNSAANQPTNWSTGDANAVNVAGTKIVKGLPIRGGTNAPAGLFWSLDTLIRVSYVGGTAKFRYDTVAAEMSILGANTPIEYDGRYYWIGLDRFMVFDGVATELPNTTNLDWFFENLNFAWRNKVFATKVPRHGEIWWFFPKGSATECNWAIIYNVRDRIWYDTPIERSAAHYSSTMRFPIWMDSSPSILGGSQYRLWQHEFGWDSVYDDVSAAIDSWFDTSEFGFSSGGIEQNPLSGINRWTCINRIEPDFKFQNSSIDATNMEVTVVGREFANSPEVFSTTYSFNSQTKKIDMRVQNRLIRLRFRSNVSNGNYHMGRVMLHLRPGDVRE